MSSSRVPYTPARRPLSSAGSSSMSSFSSRSSISTAGTSTGSISSLAGKQPAYKPTPVKYKAALSTESRPRKQVLGTVPGSPAHRSKTPSGRPGSKVDDLKMDVSMVDVEEVLVDASNVDPDISVDLESSPEETDADKVVVSIRIRSTAENTPTPWEPSPDGRSINIADPKHEYTFDHILTGTANKPIYNSIARPHVRACMRGYNAVIFAYGQTASGKTYTLSGGDGEKGLIPHALSDVFRSIRDTPSREFLLRASYLEIYNETIVDLLAPPGAPVVQIHGSSKGGDEVILAPLREEVVTSLQAVTALLARGDANRRTASTDWNARSSRSHSIFRVVVESRERDDGTAPPVSGRQTPGPASGRQTPGGGPRLQSKGGRSVQSSVLSLIDLAGSEKATTDKERTREGRYINTSLLTLGSVIGTLAENAAKGKSAHVPYRNSKLTRLLQPSLAGNARISVICTINPEKGAVSESLSTLGFAKRIRGVVLNAQKKEVVDTDALIERYRKEIEDLKKRLEERDVAPEPKARRLSAREQIDESKAMKDLQTRIQQLTRLILTSASASVAEREGDGEDDDEPRAASPWKVDFALEPYQLQEELLSARLQIDSQATQILSLEAANEVLAQAAGSTRPQTRAGMNDSDEEDEVVNILGELEKDDLNARVKELEESLEEEKRKCAQERKRREDGERWAGELTKELEREKKMRLTLEQERKALAAFVSKLDALGLGAGLAEPGSPVKPLMVTSFPPPMPLMDANMNTFPQRRLNTESIIDSPVKFDIPELKGVPSLLEEEWDAVGDVSFGSLVGGDDSFATS